MCVPTPPPPRGAAPCRRSRGLRGHVLPGRGRPPGRRRPDHRPSTPTTCGRSGTRSASTTAGGRVTCGSQCERRGASTPSTSNVSGRSGSSTASRYPSSTGATTSTWRRQPAPTRSRCIDWRCRSAHTPIRPWSTSSTPELRVRTTGADLRAPRRPRRWQPLPLSRAAALVRDGHPLRRRRSGRRLPDDRRTGALGARRGRSATGRARSRHVTSSPSFRGWYFSNTTVRA